MLKPTVNFAIYRCINNFTHPNIGKAITVKEVHAVLLTGSTITLSM